LSQLSKIDEFLTWVSDIFTQAGIEFSTFMLPAHKPKYPHILIRPETITPFNISFGGGNTDNILIVFHICSINADYQESLTIAKMIESLLNFISVTTETFEYKILFPTITFVYEEEALQKMMLEYVITSDTRLNSLHSTVDTSNK
jgi:hypothetical protein